MNLKESLVSANGGIGMYARRGGVKSAISEFELQRILVGSGVSDALSAISIGAIRLLILLAPNRVRSFVYKYVLRRS